MELFKEKTLVVSGGAEGIGFAVVKAAGHEGMNIVISDISEATLAQAEKALTDAGISVLAIRADARHEADWQRVADAAVERFGGIHALMNNAGVGGAAGELESMSLEDWRWTIDVNLMGVVIGMQTVVPHIKAAGGGWVVNVASMAGMTGIPCGGAYNATKLAVAGLSEGWAVELAEHRIQVAALCPGFVKTRIYLSDRNRPDDYAKGDRPMITTDEEALAEGRTVIASAVNGGIEPDVLAQRVIESVRAGDPYIFTHPDFRPVVAHRYQMIDQAFASAEASPIVGHIKGGMGDANPFAGSD